MWRTLLHLFLLAVGITAAQGNAQDYSNSPDPICSASEHDVGEGEVKTIPFTPPSSKSPTFYLLPEEGFQGITVVAQGQDQKEEEAWFPLGEECLSANSSWWETYVYVSFRTSSGQLRFIVKCGECNLKCSRKSPFGTLTSIQVKAHGHSHWNTTFTTSCTARNYASESKSNPLCQKPPSTTSTEPPPTTSSMSILGKQNNLMWVIPVAAVVGVALIVLAVVVARCRKRHRAAESNPPPMELTQTHDRPNSLYEPSNEFQNIAAAQGITKRDSRNSLYQPCTDFQNIAANSEQGGAKRDSRNSLYEPFSKFQDVIGHAGHRV